MMLRVAVPAVLVLAPFWLIPTTLDVHLSMTLPILIPFVYFSHALNKIWRQHMLRVYNYMGLGLVLTGVVAFAVASTPALYVPIFFSTPLKWLVMLAPLAFVMFFSFRRYSITWVTTIR